MQRTTQGTVPDTDTATATATDTAADINTNKDKDEDTTSIILEHVCVCVCLCNFFPIWLVKVFEDKRRDNSKRDINRFVTVRGNQPAELTGQLSQRDSRGRCCCCPVAALRALLKYYS